jgi:hypothetical protein
MSSDIEIPKVLTLPGGLVGMPATRTLDVLPLAGGDFVELTDRDQPDLGWLAVSAEDVRPGMTEALRSAGRIAGGDVLLALLSTRGETVTANLAGPIAVAPDGVARQLVLEDPAYELRAHLTRLAPAG